MYFYKDLYVSIKIKRPEVLRWELSRGMIRPGIYVIMLCTDAQRRTGDQLEICRSTNLRQPWYKANRPYIIGLAFGWHDAIDMVAGMVQEAIESTGDADVVSYLFPHGIRERRAPA